MIKIIKATVKKYGWGMVGMMVGLGIVDIVAKEEFRLSTWGDKACGDGGDVFYHRSH